MSLYPVSVSITISGEPRISDNISILVHSTYRVLNPRAQLLQVRRELVLELLGLVQVLDVLGAVVFHQDVILALLQSLGRDGCKGTLRLRNRMER